MTHGHPVRVCLLVFIIVSSIRYAVLSFVERLAALSQAPGSSSPREKSREQSKRSIEQNATELGDADMMLRPLLGAEAQSAARQQVHEVSTV